ncbi:MAG: hypothetical protein ACO3RB_01755 [Ilumatobacteraceae bacterium]
MTAIPSRRRRRYLAAVATSLLALVSLPAGVLIGATSLLNDSGGNRVAENPAIQIPRSELQLFVVTSARSTVAAIAVVVLAPEGRGGTIVSIPVGMAADVADAEAPRRVADAFATGGVDAVRAEVEDALNVIVDATVELDAAALGAALAGVGTQPVMLGTAVWDGAGDDITQVLKPGSAPVDAAGIAAGLAAVQDDAPESTRLPQVKALWTAVARAGVEGDVSSSPTTTVGDSATSAPPTPTEFMGRLLSGRVDVWQVSSSRLVDAQRNPAGLDLYAIDGIEALMVMASVAPGALTIATENAAVMIDMPFDDAVLTKEAVTRLSFLGAHVAVVRRGLDAPQERTLVHASDSIARTEAESWGSLMGPMEFVESDEIISGVDVVIVIGYDFKAFVAGGSSAATSTTVAG